MILYAKAAKECELHEAHVHTRVVSKPFVRKKYVFGDISTPEHAVRGERPPYSMCMQVLPGRISSGRTANRVVSRKRCVPFTPTNSNLVRSIAALRHTRNYLKVSSCNPLLLDLYNRCRQAPLVSPPPSHFEVLVHICLGGGVRARVFVIIMHCTRAAVPGSKGKIDARHGRSLRPRP